MFAILSFTLCNLHINDIWNLERAVFVYGRSKDFFLFFFEHEQDMHRIAEKRPYAIDGALLVVDYWKPDMIMEHLVMEKMVVWVKLFGLPLKCFIEEAGFRLGKAIIEVCKVDHDTLMPRNIRFLRIRVWIPIDQPLISSFFLKFRDGHHQWITYSYKRLRRVCRNYGRVGHTQGYCSLTFDEARSMINARIDSTASYLGVPVMHQANKPMYTSRIHANVHHPNQRTTQVFHPQTQVPIPETMLVSTSGHDEVMQMVAMDQFVAHWERDWEQGITLDYLV
ncbi:Uncharacterized protein LOK49_LG11G00670 [Camellia lanceoleosa]|uniref:Uncharacterized protein n=1 Tax=Camellia lanceoleosa TaxID=1840588 RepID=A0ACC0G3S4_9ERIC|nr:Uncharacterized protein LOK49_LG11G00670 [Camellia lanceoleosa]